MILFSEKEIEQTGVPAYITSVGWLGIPTDRLTEMAKQAVKDGWDKYAT